MQAGIEIAQLVCNGGNLLGQAMCRIVWKSGWQLLRDLDNERMSVWMNKMCFLMFKKWVYFFILIWIWTGSEMKVMILECYCGIWMLDSG